MRLNQKLLDNYFHKDFTMKLKLQSLKKKRNCLSLISAIPRHIWISRLEMREKRITKKVEWCLSSSKIRFQKQQKTSDHYQLVITKKG